MREDSYWYSVRHERCGCPSEVSYWQTIWFILSDIFAILQVLIFIGMIGGGLYAFSVIQFAEQESKRTDFQKCLKDKPDYECRSIVYGN